MLPPTSFGEPYENGTAIASDGCKPMNSDLKREGAGEGVAVAALSQSQIRQTHIILFLSAPWPAGTAPQGRRAMYDNPRSLLDEMTLVHGPHDVLGRYFVIADAMARECGVRLRLRTDFDALMDLNRANRATWPPLPPICDPLHCKLRADNAFWLDGTNDRGETVVTYFARFFNFIDTNLVEAIRSLRIYYDDPAPHATAGEMVEIDAPSAAVVSGRTTYGGGMWIRRDWRGTGLPKFISRVCSAYAHTLWNTAFCWGFVVPRAHALGLSRAYGPYQAIEGLTVRLAFRGDLPTVLLWMHSNAMLADLARIVDGATIDNPRQRYARHKSLASGTMPRQ